MTSERTISPCLFALLIVQARLKTARTKGIDINPSDIDDEIDEAILYVAEIDTQIAKIEWLERGQRLLEAWILIGADHMKQIAPLTYADCLKWQHEQPNKAQP